MPTAPTAATAETMMVTPETFVPRPRFSLTLNSQLTAHVCRVNEFHNITLVVHRVHECMLYVVRLGATNGEILRAYVGDMMKHMTRHDRSCFRTCCMRCARL